MPPGGVILLKAVMNIYQNNKPLDVYSLFREWAHEADLGSTNPETVRQYHSDLNGFLTYVEKVVSFFHSNFFFFDIYFYVVL